MSQSGEQAQKNFFDELDVPVDEETFFGPDGKPLRHHSGGGVKQRVPKTAGRGRRKTGGAWEERKDIVG